MMIPRSYSGSESRPSGSTSAQASPRERVPLVHVAVDEAGALVVVGGDAPLRAREGVLDRALGARTAGALPGRGDERGERAALLGPGRQADAVIDGNAWECRAGKVGNPPCG